VAGVEVRLGEGEVEANGVHVGVTEEELEGEGVATIAKVEDGEGVTEAVGVAIGDAGAGAEGIEEFEQTITGEGLLLLGEEERAVDGIIRARDEDLPEGLGGFGRERQAAFFGAFAHDLQAAVLQVQIKDAGGAELGGAQASVEEGEEEGAGAVRIVGFVRNGEQGAQVRFGEGADEALFGFGTGDLAHWVGGD